MTDNPEPAAPPAPAPPKPWIKRGANQLGVALLLLLAWSVAANSWTDKGCQTFPKGYVLVLQHFGTPSHDQGCDEYGDYTDNYYGD